MRFQHIEYPVIGEALHSAPSLSYSDMKKASAMEQHYPFFVQPLPFSYSALAPYLDSSTLFLHHGRHYPQKVKELNHLLLQHRMSQWTLRQLLVDPLNLPPAAAWRLRDAAGCVYNHELYFSSMQPEAGPPPANRLVKQLLTVYGSMHNFQRMLTEAAQSLSGVGWVWLLWAQGSGLHLAVTRDNNVVDLSSVSPIFVIDLWEHAFYQMHFTDKEQYIDNWLTLLNWTAANQRLLLAEKDHPDGK